MGFMELYRDRLTHSVMSGIVEEGGVDIAPYEWSEAPGWYLEILRCITSEDCPVWFDVADGTTFYGMRPPFRVMRVGFCGISDTTIVLVSGMRTERIERKWTDRLSKHLPGVSIVWTGGER